MHDFRCTGCRTRLKVVAQAPRCPGCGQPLERVASAADLLGYRLVEPEGDLAERIRDALAPDEPPRRIT